MLELRGVSTSYGAIEAVRNISLTVKKGEIAALIGANGAGKSTTLMTISAIIKPVRGEIFFNDERLDVLEAHDIVSRGISHVPEGRRIFAGLSVLENLKMGAYLQKNETRQQEDLKRVYHYFPILKERANQPGGTLSGGEQQMLAIGRALMARPSMLLLDEPSLGLAPIMVQKIFSIIRGINLEDGVTILLVEQNATAALKLAKRGYVLETGSIIMEDSAENLLANPKVKEAYLGI